MPHRYALRSRAAAAAAAGGPGKPPPSGGDKKNTPKSKIGGVSRQRKKCYHCGHESSLEHRKKGLPERNKCEKCGKLRDHPGKEKGGRSALDEYAYRRKSDGKKDNTNKKGVGERKTKK